MRWVRTDVLLGGVLSADAEADDEHVVHRSGHHVQLPRGVDVGQQLLVQRVRAPETEADQTELQQELVRVGELKCCDGS